eukprot:scaffold97893_cov65-Phaeocystis_antarctica.AAC.2
MEVPRRGLEEALRCLAVAPRVGSCLPGGSLPRQSGARPRPSPRGTLSPSPLPPEPARPQALCSAAESPRPPGEVKAKVRTKVGRAVKVGKKGGRTCQAWCSSQDLSGHLRLEKEMRDSWHSGGVPCPT